MLQHSYRQLSTTQTINNGQGSTNGQLNGPWSVAFDPHHNNKGGLIIVADQLNHRVQWFDRLTLRHLASYGRKGTGLGRLDNPSGLCLQPITNHLVVCDKWNHRVQVLSLDDDNVPLPLFAIGGKPIFNVYGWNEGEFIQPFGICCSPNGAIHVADFGNHRVQSFDAAGRFLSTFGRKGDGDQELSLPNDICLVHPYFSPSSLVSGMLCVTDSNNSRVSVWNYNGAGPSSSSPSSQHLFNFKVDGRIRGLCVDLKGYLHVSCGFPLSVVQIFDFRMVRSTNSCTVMKLSDNNKKVSVLRELYAPAGMCVDSCNTLMVVDYGNHRVQFFEECQH